ncbi:MAG TPA: HAD family phosphatase [Proteobacteria bacterium]|nr:HAD family phosphatase [Pseudomonadota bacterium]
MLSVSGTRGPARLSDNFRHFSALYASNFFYMKYDALIFDCDGTLADTMPAHYETWKAVFNRHGIPFSLERFYSLGGVPAREVVETVAGEAGIKVAISGFLKHR